MTLSNMIIQHFLVLFFGFTVVYGQTYHDVVTLRQNLLQNYTRSVRPVLTQNTTIYVSIIAELRMLQDFDVVKGILALQFVFHQFWRDEFINWIPQQHGNISVMYMPFVEVWAPQLMLINPAEDYDMMQKYKDIQSVEYSPAGNAVQTYIASIKATCEPFVKYFPFDTHSCDVLFMLVGFGVHGLMPVPLGTSVVHLLSNGQWRVEISSFTKEAFSTGHSYLKLTLKISRRPHFLAINLFIPIMFLSSMSLFVFVLPSDGGEKASYSITVLLALAVFMTIVMDQLPSISTDPPIISIVLLLHLAMNVVVCICTLFSLNYYYRKKTRIIPWHLRVLVTVITFRMYMSPNKVSNITDTTTSDKVRKETGDDTTEVTGPRQVTDTDQTPSLTWPLVSLAMDRLTLFVCLTLIAIECIVLCNLFL